MHVQLYRYPPAEMLRLVVRISHTGVGRSAAAARGETARRDGRWSVSSIPGCRSVWLPCVGGRLSQHAAGVHRAVHAGARAQRCQCTGAPSLSGREALPAVRRPRPPSTHREQAATSPNTAVRRCVTSPAAAPPMLTPSHALTPGEQRPVQCVTRVYNQHERGVNSRR